MWVLTILWAGNVVGNHGPYKTQDDALNAGTAYVDNKMAKGDYTYSYKVFKLSSVLNLN